VNTRSIHRIVHGRAGVRPPAWPARRARRPHSLDQPRQRRLPTTAPRLSQRTGRDSRRVQAFERTPGVRDTPSDPALRAPRSRQRSIDGDRGAAGVRDTPSDRALRAPRSRHPGAGADDVRAFTTQPRAELRPLRDPNARDGEDDEFW